MPLQSDTIPYARWSGCGNTYLFVDLRSRPESEVAAFCSAAPDLARRWSPPAAHDADGLVVLSADAKAAARMAMWNADGSRGLLCGNALRCIAHWLADEADRDEVELTLASDAGRHRALAGRDRSGRRSIAVVLPAPTFAAASIPLDTGHPAVGPGDGRSPWRIDVELDGTPTRGLALSMGNPHLILPVDGDPAALDVPRLGAPLESSGAFPERVNVSFVRVRSERVLDQRTFERGSGETAACGSGACAAVVALTTAGRLERGAEVEVRMAGGTLGITWLADGALELTGATEHLGDGRARLHAD